MDRTLYIKKKDMDAIGNIERISLYNKKGEDTGVDLVFRGCYTCIFNLGGCDESIVLKDDVEICDGYGITVQILQDGWSQTLFIPRLREVE